MMYGAIESIQRARDEYYTYSLYTCASCREPIETDVYYTIERRRLCPECAFKWLQKQAHKNERV